MEQQTDISDNSYTYCLLECVIDSQVCAHCLENPFEAQGLAHLVGSVAALSHPKLTPLSVTRVEYARKNNVCGL